MSTIDETNPAIIFNPTTSKYSVTFAGLTIETTVTDQPNIIDEWVHQISTDYAGKRTVVGLDREWMPHKTQPLMKAAMLQLCIDNKCLIVQLVYMNDFPQSLKNFLMDSNFIFVGVEVALDIAKLKQEYGLEVNQIADVRDVAKQRWPGPRLLFSGLKHLAMELVGLNMKKLKHVRTSSCETRVLSDEQVEYACIDAYASYRIGHELLIEKEGVNSAHID
ncbi:Werner Syndrome-like exonuclease [Quillaja saponaria]|uniref:Werner Syndrome-like exonuclease n=1 Tax=Quillaja saponaria TaxID=32244 RepID=A0AAD7KTY7_QUISA|nr:Werner Syndrome-like exonuclease [Quillaja saponaria]